MDNLLIFRRKNDKSLVLTQIIDMSLTIEEHVAKILANNSELEYRFSTDPDEFGFDPINVFYDCLVVTDENEVAYDMSKVREFWRTILRINREPVLAKLDIDYQRALEENDTVAAAEIVAKKNILRDATEDPRIDTATTIFELRDIYPDLLRAG